VEANTPAVESSLNLVELVAAVAAAGRALNASIVLRLFVGEGAHDQRTAERLKSVLGEQGPKIVEDFITAKDTLTRALLDACNRTSQASHDHMLALLAAGAVSEKDGWYTFNDFDGGTVTARVESISAARLREDGCLWGQLRVSPQERCFETWSFDMRDGAMTVHSKD
jgi:hypothetical protein